MTQSAAFTSRYIVVSPVKDEELYIERTIQSMLQQTVRPVQWLIVDDGSSDQTPAIIAKYTVDHDWIKSIRINRDAVRNLGVTEIRAFATGYESIRNIPHDYVVKMDCDLELPADYFERLIREMDADPELGVVSGLYRENSTGEWRPVKMPSYHAAGATKVVRLQCFRDIDGFVLDRGWDTIDEIRAQFKGWKTRHFDDVQFNHLKPEGSKAGSLSTCRFHGEIYYLTGGGLFFFLFKSLHRAISGSPFLIGGLAMFYGFVKASLSGQKRLVSDDESRFYQRMLNRRILKPLV